MLERRKKDRGKKREWIWKRETEGKRRLWKRGERKWGKEGTGRLWKRMERGEKRAIWERRERKRVGMMRGGRERGQEGGKWEREEEEGGGNERVVREGEKRESGEEEGKVGITGAGRKRVTWPNLFLHIFSLLPSTVTPSLSSSFSSYLSFLSLFYFYPLLLFSD